MKGIVKLTEASNLGVHAAGYLAARYGEGPCSAGHVAQALRVSASHLSKVLQTLAARGLLDSTRGARGGSSLARGPSEITLLEVIEALQGPFESAGCLLGKPVCARGACLFAGLERELIETIERHLAPLTLEDLAQSVRIQRGA